VAHALTMWMADLLEAASKLRRNVLPSIATIWPPLI
jgi:hypothetical protein